MEDVGNVAVVTGASSGIGRRTALDLASAGWSVCLVARRDDRLREVLEEAGGSERGHSIFVADVSDRARVAALADHVRSTHERCDALVNNAGFSNPKSLSDPAAVDTLESVMATNFYGAVYCTAALLDLLEASAPSSVVNVASVAGRLPLKGGSTYCASKFALVGWSEALAYELSDVGINVATVEPGPLPTEGFPQKEMVEDRRLRLFLTDDAAVSDAVRDVIERRRTHRTVPRWYYLLQFARLVAPRAYRSAQHRFVAARGR